MSRQTSLPVAIAVCCFGVATFNLMDALMKGAAIALGAYNALFWRCLIGGAIGGVAMFATRTPWPSAAVLRLHLLRSSVVAGMALLFFWALIRVPLAEAIALSFIAPLIALYLAAVLLGERIGREAILASVMGLAGMAVILSSKIGGGYDRDALPGALAVLASAVLYAYNLVLQRRQAQLASPVEIAFFQSILVGLVLSPAAPWLAALPAPGPMLHVVGAAMLTFIALVTLSWAYARAETQHLLPTEYTAFIWSALLGWLVFGERLAWTTLVGAVLIVAGCLIAARARP